METQSGIRLLPALEFTPIQQRMLTILADGQRHTYEELWQCLDDSLAPLSNIRAHLTCIRGKINPLGQNIICEWWRRKRYYRQIRLLIPSPPVNSQSV